MRKRLAFSPALLFGVIFLGALDDIPFLFVAVFSQGTGFLRAGRPRSCFSRPSIFAGFGWLWLAAVAQSANTRQAITKTCKMRIFRIFSPTDISVLGPDRHFSLTSKTNKSCFVPCPLWPLKCRSWYLTCLIFWLPVCSFPHPAMLLLLACACPGLSGMLVKKFLYEIDNFQYGLVLIQACAVNHAEIQFVGIIKAFCGTNIGIGVQAGLY